jgi:hypothetical protein
MDFGEHFGWRTCPGRLETSETDRANPIIIPERGNRATPKYLVNSIECFIIYRMTGVGCQ